MKKIIIGIAAVILLIGGAFAVKNIKKNNSPQKGNQKTELKVDTTESEIEQLEMEDTQLDTELDELENLTF